MGELLTKAQQTADLLRSDLIEISKYASKPNPEGMSRGDRAIAQLAWQMVRELAAIQNTLAELS